MFCLKNNRLNTEKGGGNAQISFWFYFATLWNAASLIQRTKVLIGSSEVVLSLQVQIFLFHNKRTSKHPKLSHFFNIMHCFKY